MDARVVRAGGGLCATQVRRVLFGGAGVQSKSGRVQTDALRRLPNVTGRRGPSTAVADGSRSASV